MKHVSNIKIWIRYTDRNVYKINSFGDINK